MEEVALLRQQVAELHKALAQEWELNHAERCDITRDCTSFKRKGYECMYPRPDALRRFPTARDLERAEELAREHGWP